MLELVGLPPGQFLARFPRELSGGQRQRVGVARALAGDPPLLLMDEPFGALDAQTRAMMHEVLLDIWTRIPTTTVFVTHDIDEALFLADRVIMMSARPGQIIEDIRLPFGRPRHIELVTDMEFVRLKRHFLDLLKKPDRALHCRA
jgi:NitT/TauT family transport system ATP-binding protein